ncbi:Efflux pump antibiotic resistance protein [Coniochaeta hoffmannii]|uniref:Efflux pump antibiotic resistance protein n=1 Tax=Coniochaeta hoffmannii TaxID=91930 RepID=A0AA38RT95_9PEZI|nr:Efflux pump antibiotic resistance protein [Coniochaeta hoffmannii]
MKPDVAGNGEKKDTEAGGDAPQAAETSPATDAEDYPAGATLAFIVVALAMSMFLVALDMTIIATAAFFVTSGGFQSSWGKAFKYFSLKATYLAAIFIFELGSLICGVAPTSTALVVGRAIAGVGAAGVSSGTYTLIALAARPEKGPVFVGNFGLCFGVASVAGPLLSAMLLQMDPVGTALALGAIIAYILAMQYGGQTAPWNSSKVVGLLMGFVLITAAFVAWEMYAGERAMMPPRLMKERVVWFNATLSPTASGVRSLPLILTTSVAIIILGMTVKHFGSYTTLVMAFCAAVAAVAIGLMITFDIGNSLGREVGYQLLAGFAFGFPFQLPVIHGQTQSKADDLAVVTAIIIFSETIAGAILLSAAQCAFVNQMLETLAVTAPDVDPAKLIATGVSEIRDTFPAEQIPGILLAYMAGLRVPFAIATSTAGAACVLACIVAVFPNHLEKQPDGAGGGLESSTDGSEGIKNDRPASE